jgi:ABC-type oligopeptide transport system ATPase subunit
LFRGDIVEMGDAAQVHDAPVHSYTQALLSAAPVPNPTLQKQRREAWRTARG